MHITGNESWKCEVCNTINSCEYSYCKNKCKQCITYITLKEKKLLLEQALLIDKLKTEIAKIFRIPKSRL